MTVIETNNKYLIFDSEELRPHGKMEIVWEQNPYIAHDQTTNQEGEEVVRDLNLDSNPPTRRSRFTLDEGQPTQFYEWLPEEGT